MTGVSGRGVLMRARAIVAVAASLALAACGTSPTPDSKGLACFPKDARPYVFLNETKDLTRKEGAQGVPATIYVDRSASMVGYLRGATETDRPLHDLIGSLPETLKEVGATPSYRPFGIAIGEPVADFRQQLADPGFFACAKPGDSGCESRLDVVLSQVAATPGEMAVVLTDLWFDNSQVMTSGVTDLKPPLVRILSDNRAVAVYGFSAPFVGKIYDLPVTSGARSLPYTGRHPLFMLVVGTKAQVIDFGEQLKRFGSRSIKDGLTAGTTKRSIFTVAPGPDHPRDKEPMEPGKNPVLRAQNFTSFGKAIIQQFVMGAGPIVATQKPLPPGPAWTGPRPDNFIDDAVYDGPMTPQTKVWRQMNEDCKDTSWISVGTMDGGWTKPEATKHSFTLDPGRLFARVGRNGTYLVSGELTRTSVSPDNAANKWIAEWSFGPAEGAGVAQRAARDGIFPTLNVKDVAALMEDSLATAAERRGGGITGFSVLVKVDR